ncbi:MAG: peptidylprolyl isomerase [Myxococcota bacterium]|nr:peptidylprolyl isomerase [Myxococcota bacterium]
MLDFFRHRGLSNVIYGAVIVATILAFVITFRPNATSRTASLKEACAARVRGRCIDPKDFGSAYRILMPSRSSNLSRKMNLKRIALDGLIERELLGDEAKRLGIAVTDMEVTDQLYTGYVRVSVPASDPSTAQSILLEMYQSYARAGLISQEIAQAHFNERDTAIPVDFRDPKTKAFDMKMYERQVRNLSNRSTAEFREEQARELLAAKMREVIRDPVRVSENEAWQEYERRYNTATVSWIPVKESWAVRWAVGGKPEDIDSWVKGQPSDFEKTFEERAKEDAPKAGHLRHILVKLPYGAGEDEKALAVAKLSWAAARIRAGESFAEVARDTSDDSGSAAMGGDVGDKTDGFVAPFKAAADALKPGETTAGAVETQFGFHFIERDDPAKAAEVESRVKRDVSRSMYGKAKGTDAARAIAAKIGEELRAGKSAEDAIKTAIGPYSRESKVTPLKVLPAPAATSPEGGPVRAGTPDAAASQPTALSLAEKRFDASTDTDRPQVQTSTAFNGGGDPFPGLSPEGTTGVLGFAFHAKEGDVTTEPIRSTEGFAVVQLKERKIATREEFQKDRETFEEELLRAKRDETLSLYVKRLREQAKADIQIDPAYIQEARVDGGATAPTDEEDEY